MIMVLFAMVLSVVKANGWVVVPTYIIWLSWGLAVVYFGLVSWAKSVANQVNKQLLAEVKRLKKERESNV